MTKVSCGQCRDRLYQSLPVRHRARSGSTDLACTWGTLQARSASAKEACGNGGWACPSARTRRLRTISLTVLIRCPPRSSSGDVQPSALVTTTLTASPSRSASTNTSLATSSRLRPPRAWRVRPRLAPPDRCRLGRARSPRRDEARVTQRGQAGALPQKARRPSRQPLSLLIQRISPWPMRQTRRFA